MYLPLQGCATFPMPFHLVIHADFPMGDIICVLSAICRLSVSSSNLIEMREVWNTSNFYFVQNVSRLYHRDTSQSPFIFCVRFRKRCFQSPGSTRGPWSPKLITERTSNEEVEEEERHQSKDEREMRTQPKNRRVENDLVPPVPPLLEPMDRTLIITVVLLANPPSRTAEALNRHCVELLLRTKNRIAIQKCLA
jgi:hypothetical protein